MKNMPAQNVIVFFCQPINVNRMRANRDESSNSNTITGHDDRRRHKPASPTTAAGRQGSPPSHPAGRAGGGSPAEPGEDPASAADSRGCPPAGGAVQVPDGHHVAPARRAATGTAL